MEWNVSVAIKVTALWNTLYIGTSAYVLSRAQCTTGGRPVVRFAVDVTSRTFVDS